MKQIMHNGRFYTVESMTCKRMQCFSALKRDSGRICKWHGDGCKELVMIFEQKEFERGIKEQKDDN